jgi:hypothetical protein
MSNEQGIYLAIDPFTTFGAISRVQTFLPTCQGDTSYVVIDHSFSDYEL